MRSKHTMSQIDLLCPTCYLDMLCRTHEAVTYCWKLFPNILHILTWNKICGRVEWHSSTQLLHNSIYLVITNVGKWNCPTNTIPETLFDFRFGTFLSMFHYIEHFTYHCKKADLYQKWLRTFLFTVGPNQS